MSILSWFKPKTKFKEVAYGWPEYSTIWYIYEYDEKNDKWRITKDDLFADERPSKYDISRRLINFSKEATQKEQDVVNHMLASRLHRA